MEILKDNKNLQFSDEDLKKYTALFASYPTQETKDTSVHAANVKKELADRGITFIDNDKIKLVTVMIHDASTNTINPAHAGVVFTTDDGYLLIEKLAQYTPFVSAKFATIEELSTYMLSEVQFYVQEGDTEAFLMLNDEKMENNKQNNIS